MIYISHRGNISGRNPERENTPDYISEAILAGYDVEVDVWFVENKFFLGHDSPDVEIQESYLENKRLWCHAKNLEALDRMLQNKKIHCFWHQSDEYTITSKRIVWAFPGKLTSSRSICVMPENFNYEPLKESCAGVCSDYIQKIRRGL